MWNIHQFKSQTIAFKQAANTSQIKYGTCSQAASIFVLAKHNVISNTRNTSKKIHSNAPAKAWVLKNISDQKKFTISCAINKLTQCDLLLMLLLLTTIHIPIPISAYKIDHTTGKTHPGGVIGGFCAVAW